MTTAPDNSSTTSDDLSILTSSDVTPIEVPGEFRKALLDFSVAFLMERPQDIVDYAVTYFRNIKIQRTKLRTQLSQTSTVPSTKSAEHSVTERGSTYLRELERKSSIKRSLSDITEAPDGSPSNRRQSAHIVDGRRVSMAVETVTERDSIYQRDIERRSSIIKRLSENTALPKRTSLSRQSIRASGERKVSIAPDNLINLITTPRGSRKSIISSIYRYEPLPVRQSVFIEEFDTGIIINEDEPEPEPTEPARRKSVFAESFEPDDASDGDSEQYHCKANVVPKTREEKSRIRQAIKKVLVFKTMDRKQIHDVINTMQRREVNAEEVIVEQNDTAGDLYIIDKGTFNVYRDDIHVYTFTNEGVFGELALLSSRMRLATIVAQTEGRLWSLDRQSFRLILESKAYYKRKFFERQLRKVYMLQVLPKEKLLNLADALQERTYKLGESIFLQGETPDGMYIVLEGVVQIRATDKDGTEKDVHKIGDTKNFFDELALIKIKSKTKSAMKKEIHKLAESQKFFGELALLKNQHTVRIVSAFAASRHVKLAFLSLESFDRIVGDSVEECYESIGKTHPHYSNLLKFYRSLNLGGKLL